MYFHLFQQLEISKSENHIPVMQIIHLDQLPVLLDEANVLGVILIRVLATHRFFSVFFPLIQLTHLYSLV